MLRFDPNDWISGKKAEFAINRPTLCKMRVSCTTPVSVSVDGIPVKSGNEFTFTLYLTTGLLELKAKEEFGASLTFKDAQSGEPFDRKEVVALAVQGNMLRQIRRQNAREEHAMRQALVDHTALSYQVDEDDFRFEEEIMGNSQTEQSEQSEGESSNEENQSSGETGNDSE